MVFTCVYTLFSCGPTLLTFLKLFAVLAIVYRKLVFTPVSILHSIVSSCKPGDANRASAGASRSLLHNVPRNVNHNGPWDFSGDAPFANGNNIGFKGCRQINLQTRYYLRRPVRYSRS